MTELLKKIGQLFIIGFADRTPSSEFLNFINEENIGGVILFKANCPTHQVVQKNIQRIKDHCCQNLPFIAVDQEGGRVCRVTGAPAEFAAAARYGSKLGLERFGEDFSRAALCLERLGINLILGPVADIHLNNKNQWLRDRCFGRSADKVIPFVEKAVEIAKSAGLLCCLKHFPGLGAAETDPHLSVATVDYDELVWEQRERLPFAAGAECGADMIMTTHLKAPAIDSQIATGSSKIVSRLIREALAFDGPIITDDLSMNGADVLGKPGERAVAAFNAGHDLLLFGQNQEEAMLAYDYFRDAVSRGEVSPERVRASLDRVVGIKFKLGKSAVF